MHAKKILMATDFSGFGDTAMKLATSLARDTGAQLMVVHVMPPPLAAIDADYVGYGVEEDEATRRKHLAAARPDDPNISFSHHLLHGQPAEAIVEFAEEQEVDMIIIGSHGRRGLTRLLMGSVAEHIVRHARVPVLTVKNTEKSAAIAD